MLKQSCLAVLLATAIIAWIPSATADDIVLPAQGVLRTVAGVPAPDGLYPVTFKLYDSQAADAAVWSETYLGISVADGVFSVQLGSQEPLSDTVIAGAPQLWLGATVSIDPELPRVRIHTVPFAVRASSAGALACTGCVTTSTLHSSVAESIAKAEADAAAVKADLAATLLLRVVADEAAMNAISAPGQLAFRTDLNALFLYAGGEWLKLATQDPCGDGVIDPATEICEPGQIGDATCASLVGADYTGTVTCGGDCATYNTTACSQSVGTETNPAASCKAILDAGGSTGDGQYFVNSALGAVKVYCDMSGGGWTLVASWPYDTFEGNWGTTALALDDPKPGTKHIVPFISVIPSPSTVRMVYLPNGETLEKAVAAGAAWETASKGARIALADGNFLIWDEQGSCQNYGVCFVNGTYSNGFLCDGNSGQVGGQGLFNCNTSDEFCGCGSHGWKSASGGCSASVCNADGQVAIYLR